MSAETEGKHVILNTQDPLYISTAEYARNAVTERDDSDTENA